jgi:hypothetical protein
MRIQCSPQALLLASLVAASGAGCLSDLDTRPPRRAISAGPLVVRLSNAGTLHNRHDYDITQHPWGSPNTHIGDEVWRAALPLSAYTERSPGIRRFDLSLEAGELASALNEPAPYTQGTPVALDADVGWSGAGRAPEALRVQLTASLQSMTDPALAPIALLTHDATLTARAPDDPARFVGLRATTAALPARLDLYVLTLEWTITPQGCEGACPPPSHSATRHRVPLTWRTPRRELPRFREPFIWAAAWAAGQWPDGPRAAPDTIKSELGISEALLKGFATLNTVGHSYGAFPRPKYDGKNSGLEMFLDFPRTACGEFKFGLMALIETHGIDAQWGALHFTEPGSRDRLSFYKTRPLAALGRETIHWYYANHAFTLVRGHVFDPTYNVSRPSLAEYDDFMFEKYCYGEDTPCKVNSWCDSPPADEATRCVVNPPGFDKEGPLHFYSGDGYY